MKVMTEEEHREHVNTRALKKIRLEQEKKHIDQLYRQWVGTGLHIERGMATKSKIRSVNKRLENLKLDYQVERDQFKKNEIYWYAYTGAMNYVDEKIKKLQSLEVAPNPMIMLIDLKPYLSVLKCNQVIDSEGKYAMGPRQKGAAIAWIDLLLNEGRVIMRDEIVKKLNDIDKAHLLNKWIPGLDLSPSTVRNNSSNIYQDLYPEFEKDLQTLGT